MGSHAKHPNGAKLPTHLWIVEHVVVSIGVGVGVAVGHGLHVAVALQELERVVEDVELGNLLLKPNPLLPPSEIGVEYTQEKYGSVPRYYIKGMLPVAMQDYLLENNPPNGVLELASDHSPFFSTPDELVKALVNITASLK
ncbi:putative methylesterase 13, chloroplastic [Selaginella moellendorffii]|uniref:putative methylesterase 13, chloroplastic n=1 Tax=Selaginella moellendorffii TaxID=88036 RepID=UPI000D1C9678|nr:putative methylesterase 13, chloroplastic [Selaginella moellendorffii]|eukprot:XP_024536037.1 putative methylesterase 13, chloroplastic [Selaginella moellendorffii]